MAYPDLAAASLGDATYTRIRADIIACRLEPGQRLRLEPLRERYGVGVSTLREILSRLASESLVEAEGQKGFAVAAATEKDLREVADLRLLLESHALGSSFAHGDLDWEGRVVAAHHKLAATEKQLLSGQERQTVNWVKYDFAFHNALISACGSTVLLNLHAAVFDRFLRYHMLARSFRGSGVVDDHRTLFEMALARDARGAQAMLAAHVNRGVEHVLSKGRLRNQE